MWINNFINEKFRYRNLCKYFSFRFADVPDESFTAHKEMNDAGIELTIYKKTLNTKELGIFDTIEIIISSTNAKTIILRTSEANKICWIRVKRLVDHIFLCLGPDDEKVGRWNVIDKELFESGVFWARYWLEERHNPKVILSLSKAKSNDAIVSTFELSMMHLGK